MNWLTRIRTSMMIPSSIVAAVLFLNNSGLGDTSGVNYSIAVAVNAVASLSLLSGLPCLAAAWEGARLRQGRVLEAAGPRSTPARLAVPITIAAAPAALFAAARFAADGVLLKPEGLLLAVVLLQFVAWAVAGMAFGLALPRAISLPIAAIVPTLTTLFLPAQPATWLRYLTGYWQSCCDVGTTLHPLVLAPTSLFAAALVTASCTSL